MARELGLNPSKLDNHLPEPWKAPLPQFIQDLYVKRFGRERPADVKTIEEIARATERHRTERTARRTAPTPAAAPSECLSTSPQARKRHP